LFEQVRRNELPTRDPGRKRAHDGSASRAREADEKAHIASMRDDVDRALCTGGDRPRARESPVGDDAIDVESSNTPACRRDPPRGPQRSQRPLANPRRGARPAESTPGLGRHDGDDVSAAFARSGVCTHEVPGRVLLVGRPAGRDQGNAHQTPTSRVAFSIRIVMVLFYPSDASVPANAIVDGAMPVSGMVRMRACRSNQDPCSFPGAFST
jgi:hypothetical protein